MALPSNWDLVPVRGKYVAMDGQPVKGTVIFTPKALRLVDGAVKTVIIGASISVTLDDTGAFTTNLAASDDPDVTGTPFTYNVRENFTGGSTYDITVPLSAGVAGVEIAQVAPVPPNSGTAASPVTRLEFDALTATVDGLSTGAVVNGLPTGGATGQILAKTSGADYATTWIPAPTGGGTVAVGSAPPNTSTPGNVYVQLF